MRRLICLMILLWAPAVAAAGIQDGLDALKAKNFDGARNIFQALAAQNNNQAQFMLGVMAEQGWGVAASPGQAAVWYERAAVSGNASAQYNLGIYYQLGHGVPQSDVQAARWLEAAAAQRHARAQNNLATIYFTGAGVQRNNVEALKWQLLALQGLRGQERELADQNRQNMEGGMSADERREARRRVDIWQPGQ